MYYKIWQGAVTPGQQHEHIPYNWIIEFFVLFSAWIDLGVFAEHS